MEYDQLFLDTSYILALILPNDQCHPQALRYWTQFLKTDIRLVTTSYVFDETITYLNARGLHEAAVRVGEQLMTSSSVLLIHVDKNLFSRGWEYFKNRPDKKYSLTDSISFVVMTDMNLSAALAFDQHFTQAGFEIEPN